MQHYPQYRLALSALVATALITLAAPTATAGLPDSPDGTVKAVLESLADRHPEILWEALPASYQNDITEITHLAANKVDPELWGAIFGLGGKVAGVLRDQRNYFLNSSLMSAAGEERDRIEGNWDTAVAAMDSFFTSDLANLENLKTMDWEKFLSTTVVEMMDSISQIQTEDDSGESGEDIIEMLRKTSVETVSTEGDKATVRISAPDEDPEEILLTCVEGRWIPSEMANDWETNMAEAKKNLASIDEEQMAEAKMQAMMVFGTVEAALDQLAAAGSQEEFDTAIQGLLGPFLGMAGGMQDEMQDEMEEQTEE